MSIEKIKQQTDSVNTTLVYTLDANEAVDQFSQGMLSNNNIKGVLPYNCEIINGVKSLTYVYPKGISFSTLMKRNMNKTTFLTILKNIADIVVRIEDYMLDADKLLLDEDYVFVDSNTLDVNVVFVPTDKPYGKSLRLCIKSSLSHGVFDTSTDTSYVINFNNYLNSNRDASAKEISDYIESLLGNVKQDITVNSHYETPQPFVSPIYNAPNEQNDILVQSEISDQAKKKKSIFGNMFKKKEKEDQQESLSAFGGIAIPNSEPSPAPKPNVQKNNDKQPVLSGAKADNAYSTPNVAAASVGNFNSDTSGEETIALMPNDNNAGELMAFLEQTNGTSVAISKNCFFVGKGINTSIKNDYVINNDRVSRNHAIFETANGRYYIKDNNSLNGTFVNGSRIPPNVQVELKDGDSVAFANENFTFRIKRV